MGPLVHYHQLLMIRRWTFHRNETHFEMNAKFMNRNISVNFFNQCINKLTSVRVGLAAGVYSVGVALPRQVRLASGTLMGTL